MSQSVTLNVIKTPATITQEQSCCTELLDRIVAIWKRAYNWICEWVSWLICSPEYNLAKRAPDAFCQTMKYLSPQEVAKCELVCKSWRSDRIWQMQCANYGVTVAPPSGRFKELFEVPEMAFGPREWLKHFGKIGPMPPLPVNIKTQVAQLKETHTLTLIPVTVDGQPLSFNTFAPLAKKSGMKLDIWNPILEKYGNESVRKSLWVWMRKNIEPGSTSKTQEQAANEYSQKLGKALFYTISIVAHFARYKIALFDTYTDTRTSDAGTGDWHVVVGSSNTYQHNYNHEIYYTGKLTIWSDITTSGAYLGVAPLMPADAL